LFAVCLAAVIEALWQQQLASGLGPIRPTVFKVPLVFSHTARASGPFVECRVVWRESSRHSAFV
jgi:hypothetical protein